MEKTIIINIGNTIIHIEESAYELLKTYINEIKQHFVNDADDVEIVTDIENRIAELLLEQLESEKKQVVDLGNVQSVIAQMGKVNDFDMLEDEPVININQTPPIDKKLYRDMDERVIAGVCAGIAHYVNVDVKWIRLIAILAAFLAGSSFLIYALFWIVIPKAKSRIEKMEMKGEPANLKGFQKNLNEELQAVKERLSEVNKQAQPFFTRFGIFIGEFFEWLGRFVSGTGKVILKAIAAFIVFFGSIFLLILIIGVAAFQGFWDASIYENFPFSAINDNRSIILFSAFALLFIPILTLVLFSIRVAFNRFVINRMISFGLLIVWLTALVTIGYNAAKISSEFKQHAEIKQTADVKSYPTYVIDIDENKYFSKEDSLAFSLEANKTNKVVVEDHENSLFSPRNNVRINIHKSEKGVTRLTQKYQSQGKTFPIAIQNAQNINYSYQVKDSLLLFNPHFQLTKGKTWRNQEVNVNLEIPVGTKLVIKKELNRYIENYWTWDCKRDESDSSVWIMTNDGLKCKYDLDHPEENKEN